MITRTRILATAAAASLMMLTACDGDDPGDSNPTTPNTPPPSSAPSSAPAAAKAPSVQEPLDASSFVADPCRSLTDAQRQDFKLSEGAPDDSSTDLGAGCFWKNDAGARIEVVYNPELTNGLSHLYAQNATGHWNYWEPTQVDGYPAVIAMIDKPAADCNLAVATSDALFFQANVWNPDHDDNCVAAENVAAAVLATIEAGGA